MLNTSTNFNINSASHCNKDAVLGQIVLKFNVCNEMGDEQVIEQNCLILRLNWTYNLFYWETISSQQILS